ncbi:MAG: DUF350 domain-containing protein [Flavobacteriales bacterium]|jgi:uncharacterized membrane protein YjfL (UPF0719 family)|nr:DUF350 domain-containing protein [Flavobacteriales bacterium]
MNEFFTNPDSYFATFAYTILSLFFLVVSRKVYQLLHKEIDMNHELVEQDNFAFAFANVGYLSGIVIALGGALTGGTTGNLVDDLTDFSLYALISIILLNLSIVLNDFLILRRMNLKHELVEDQNVGVGVLEAAISVATGLIIYGAVSGDSHHDVINGFLSTIIFWGVGMLMFVLSTFVYNAILNFSLLDEIKKNNFAVGIAYSGVIISIANLIRHGIQGDFISWEVSAYSILYNSVIALAILPVVRVVADKLLLPGQKLTDELVNQEKPNVGAGLVEAFAYVGCSILLDWTL